MWVSRFSIPVETGGVDISPHLQFAISPLLLRSEAPKRAAHGAGGRKDAAVAGPAYGGVVALEGNRNPGHLARLGIQNRRWTEPGIGWANGCRNATVLAHASGRSAKKNTGETEIAGVKDREFRARGERQTRQLSALSPVPHQDQIL